MKIHEDGQHSQAEWGETRSNQAAALPLSLRDVAATWFDSLPVGSVNNWEELVEAYMSKFFPPATSEIREEIIVFKQGEYESLYNAWERYKRLLKRCPMHGIYMTTQMDILSCYELCLQGYN